MTSPYTTRRGVKCSRMYRIAAMNEDEELVLVVGIALSMVEMLA
jgi:hypothetical protein